MRGGTFSLDADLTTQVVDNVVQCSLSVLALRWQEFAEVLDDLPTLVESSVPHPIESAIAVWGPLDGEGLAERTVALAVNPSNPELASGQFEVAPAVGEEFPLAVLVTVIDGAVRKQIRQALKERLTIAA